MDVGLSFGSVGDIIAICQLIAELSKALNDATGSAAQYQEICKELNGFVSLLMQVSSLSPSARRFNLLIGVTDTTGRLSLFTSSTSHRHRCEASTTRFAAS